MRHLLRPRDRLSAIELHPADAVALAAAFSGDPRVRETWLDGWLALAGHLPPKERRGLVLVDPPFEVPGEWDRMVDGLAAAQRRFPAGTYCLWYPLKRDAAIGPFHARLAGLGITNIYCIGLTTRDERLTTGLAGAGLGHVVLIKS